MPSESHPTVSVVIPTYNRASLVVRSIRSVLNQSYADFELLVIDDGSTDDTADAVAGLSDPRVRYVGLPKNGGTAAACNVGIRMSRGRFVSFQGSDDEWLPDNLAEHISMLERNPDKLGVVYSDMYWVPKEGSVKYARSADGTWRLRVNGNIIDNFQGPAILLG